MRVRLCLLGLALCGLALLFVPKVSNQFPHDSGIMLVWKESLQLFAIPIILFMLSLRSRHGSRILTVFWGLWVLGISIWGLGTATPPLTQYATVFVVLGLNLAAGSVLFSLMGPSVLTRKAKKEKRKSGHVLQSPSNDN